MPNRREFLVAGLGLAATPLLTRVANSASAAQKNEKFGQTPFSTRAYGASSATSHLTEMQIQRRAVGPNDILIDIPYCGLCHSDIHVARNEWASTVPTEYPAVPGHEFWSHRHGK
jgi:uncharacterized zinc-type alcohol dehydrogenase-like protein